MLSQDTVGVGEPMLVGAQTILYLKDCNYRLVLSSEQSVAHCYQVIARGDDMYSALL